MIIVCPHCQTKYQVAYQAIGSAGRKVQCAHCSQAWDQRPVPPDASLPIADPAISLSDLAEDLLDEALVDEAAASAARQRLRKLEPVEAAAPVEPAPAPAPAPAPKVDELLELMPPPNAAEIKQRQAEFSKRQHALSSRLPLARMRRGARMASAVVLVALLAGAYFGRLPLVERYPQLAGLYQAVGLGVNVVGLEFSNLQTLRSLSQGKDVLTVSAQIVGVARKPVAVPPVVVSLLNGDGEAVYEWSVNPRVPDLMAGERATFDTRLTVPPTDAQRVRLSFASSAGVQRASADPVSTAVMPQTFEPIAHAVTTAPPAAVVPALP